MDPSPTAIHVALIGASLAANKGAAAMLQTVIEELPSETGTTSFSVLSTFPADERRLLDACGHPEVAVLDLRPLRLAAVEVPLAVLGRAARALRVPDRWTRWSRVGRSLRGSDVVVDLAGISFVDGRGLPILVYNTLMTGLPLLHGAPTVKAAQALGPFERLLNRVAARVVLPRLAWIGARGRHTRDNLTTLGLDNVEDVADLAFSLSEADDLPEQLAHRLSALGDYVVVMPSAVVKRMVQADGIDYTASMAKMIDGLASRTGMRVVVAPHSYRPHRGEGRMNDGPTCRAIHESLTSADSVILIDEELDAAQLRAVIARGRLLVTSRFHAMISGLATATPTVVIGWSHKYREVMAEFDMADLVRAHADLAAPDQLVDLAVKALERGDEIAATIRQHLPEVEARSRSNMRAIARVARTGRP